MSALLKINSNYYFKKMKQEGVDSTNDELNQEQQVWGYDNLPILSYNEYLEKASNGFGKLQMITLIVVFLIKIASYFFFTNIGFLESFPVF